MSFQWSNDKYLNAFPAHPESHSLHGEGFSGSGCSKNGNVGILILFGVKNIGDDQGVIMFVDTKKNAVVITNAITDKWITACRTGSQRIAFGKFVKFFVQADQRKRRQESLLLQKVTGAKIHVLRNQQLFHFLNPPLEFFQIVSCDCNQQVHIVEVFIVGESLL